MPKRLNISVNAKDATPAARASTSGNLPATDMSAARATIVNELWRLLNNNTDAASTPAGPLMQSFEEQRCPQVQHGELSAAEMEQLAMDEMVCEPEQEGGTTVVTKESFFSFHANLLAGFPDHTEREVTLLLRWIWKQNQPDCKFRTLRKDELAGLTKELFASSAYRGQRFQDLPEEDDKVDMALGTEGMSKLDPFPMPKPGMLAAGAQGHFYASVPMQHHKTRLLRNGDETVKNHPAFTGEPHKAGCVATNPKSVGFLDSESFNKGYGGGALDDNVVDAVNRGKAAEQEAAQRRAEVLSAPYATADPPHFKSTSQMEHLDFSRVVDRKADPGIVSSGKEWTSRDGAIRGPRGLRPAGDGQTAPDALPAALTQQEQELLARNRQAFRRGPKFDAQTTQRESFAPLDMAAAVGSNDRWAEHPTQHAAQAALAESCEGRGGRRERRYGSLETEYSAKIRDPGPNKEFSTKFHHPNVLDLKNGTSQFKNKWHRPREAPLGETVRELAAATVVPQQFATTAKHFYANEK